MALLVVDTPSGGGHRELAPPPPGVAVTFVVDVDASTGAYSLPAAPAAADEAAGKAGEPTFTITSLLDGRFGLSFGGPVAAMSGEMELKAGEIYSFDTGEGFSFNGLRGVIRTTPSCLRPGMRQDDGRSVVVACTGFAPTSEHVYRLSAMGAHFVDGLTALPQATHLIVATAGAPECSRGLRRTSKLLAAAVLPNVSVVSFKWLEDSLACGAPRAAAAYTPSDPAHEVILGTSLRKLSSPGGAQPLDGAAIFVHVELGARAPPMQELHQLIQMAGGEAVLGWSEFPAAAAPAPISVVACFGAEVVPDQFKSADASVIDGEGVLRSLAAKSALDVGSWRLPSDS